MCTDINTSGVDAHLRQALQAMTEEADGARHPELLREMSLAHPNTIKILDSVHPLRRYTCFVHAFGFTEQPHYVSIAEIGFNYVYAGPEFGLWLIDNDISPKLRKRSSPQTILLSTSLPMAGSDT